MKLALATQIKIGDILGAFCLAFFLFFNGQIASCQSLYPEDFVERLASAAEIRESTGIKSRLQKKEKTAEPFFKLTEEPFSDIPPAPDQHSVRKVRGPKQWFIPPFSDIAPALPADIPEEVRQQIEDSEQPPVKPMGGSIVAPAGFPSIEVPQRKTYSARLRPRVVPAGQEFVFRIKELVPPFSLRRYYNHDRNIFVQIAAFGGTTSWSAEEAYRAMKQVTVKQEKIEGIGTEAFLTRIKVIDPASLPPEQTDTEGPPLPSVPPFAEIAPKDRARPELLDSARAVALTAPAFKELAVKDLEGKRISFPSKPKKYYPKGGEVKQSLWVLVAFFPEQAVTISFALEERLGNVQDLIDLALAVQRKLLAYDR